MPSTYQRLAVDFDGDGRRDIVASVPDALGSTANFLARAGWQTGEPWGFEVKLPPGYGGPSGRRNKQPLAKWSALGITRIDGSPLAGGGPAGLAAAHEAEDKKRRDEIERRNKLDNLCYTLEKQIADNKDKLGGVNLGAIEGLIKEGREAIEKQDDDKVQDVSARLEKEAHAMAAKLYETSGAQGAAPGAAPAGENNGAAGEGKKGDVIDAEFEESN
jgi:hypothetical protein